MGIFINNKTLRKLPDVTLVMIAILVYIPCAYFYYSIKQVPFAARIIVTDTKLFGTLTRTQHIALYFFIGYFIPNRFWLVMALGAGWEMAEYSARLYFRDPWWGCGSDYVKDLVANTVGYCAGWMMYMRCK
jgi:hypothetical protein